MDHGPLAHPLSKVDAGFRPAEPTNILKHSLEYYPDNEMHRMNALFRSEGGGRHRGFDELQRFGWSQQHSKAQSQMKVEQSEGLHIVLGQETQKTTSKREHNLQDEWKQDADTSDKLMTCKAVLQRRYCIFIAVRLVGARYQQPGFINPTNIDPDCQARHW